MKLDYYVDRPFFAHIKHSALEHGYTGLGIICYTILLIVRYYVCLAVYGIAPTSGVRGWLLRRIGVKVGANVQIGPLNWFDFVWPNYIEIGDGTSLAGMTTIIAHSTPLKHHAQYFDSYVKPVKIGKNVWIAVSCTLLSGVTIGDGAVIAAGSVVTGDIPRDSFAGGVPAKVIRSLNGFHPRTT